MPGLCEWDSGFGELLHHVQYFSTAQIVGKSPTMFRHTLKGWRSLFPAQSFLSEVTVIGGAAIDGAKQIEPFDDRRWPKVKSSDKLDCRSVLPRTKCVDLH